jgi:hypothetical protein
MPRPPLQPEPPALLLFPFRYRDARTGKWLKARYVAERHEIAQSYAEWEIVGPPETRKGQGEGTSNFLWGATTREERVPHAVMPAFPDDLQAAEIQLVRVFLQRYATWCLRTRRFAQAQGAANLARGLVPASR